MRSSVPFAVRFLVVVSVPALAQPSVLAQSGAAAPTLRGGDDALFQLRQRGLEVFAVPKTREEGFGDGAFDPRESNPREPGQRPTLQGQGTFLRLNGLDAQSCNECHSIVSNRTRPPTLGIGGVGSAVQNAIIKPTVVDVADSTDDRTQYEPGHDPDLDLRFDGVADYNGRVSNPPFLFGGGGVELLAKEMTLDLQRLLEKARSSPPGTRVDLRTHRVSFGFLVSLGGGAVDLSGVEGLGPADRFSVPPEEVLVVRPFGRKGEAFSMRDFDRGAMRFHCGLEPVEVVGENVDADGDGVVNEVSVEDMTALHVFDVTNPPPVQQRLDGQGRRGRRVFLGLGCAECHRPFLETRSRLLPLAYPEVAEDPSANVYATIDLTDFGFEPSPRGGVFVPMFSDLKRHDMGPELEESFEGGEIGNEMFITARLWGIADTAPYLHDARALTLTEAISAHGGEAQSARDAFLGLSQDRREALLHFLGHLRTPRNPNEELLPLPDR